MGSVSHSGEGYRAAAHYPNSDQEILCRQVAETESTFLLLQFTWFSIELESSQPSPRFLLFDNTFPLEAWEMHR